MAANALMKRGKRTVALSVKDECTRNSSQPQLTELLNYLLDPQQSIDSFENIDWLRWLLSGGATFDEFAKEVKKYDNAVTCGLVWTQDFVAYRCRTCGISPCMSLCADCFQSSDHKGHDFNMFRSLAGGACDCGDVTVMKQEGFCPRHGPKQGKVPQPPVELMSVARSMMPKLVFRFVQHARELFTPDMRGTFRSGLGEAEQFLNLLHQLSDMGAAMRDVIADVLTDCGAYASLTALGESATASQIRSAANYKVALESLATPSVPEEFSDVECINAPLVHKTLLQELLFWTVKLEFPATLVTFLLSLLPSNTYKEAFTGAFVQHYSRICCSLVHCTDRAKTANRVVHVSVQLLSPQDLATKMVEEHKLLHIMCTCLRHIMEGCLTTCGLHQCTHSSALVVDCTRDVLKEHCYWPIVSDLINILSHKPVTKVLLEDSSLLLFWFELLAYFQGMNVNSRELHQHVEYEPDHYYAAFSAELEVCASTMWSILAHCKTQEGGDYTHGVILVITKVLRDWLESVGVTPFSKPQPLRGSFHLPLHRQLANFISTAVAHHGASLAALLPPPDVIQMIMIHPLQLQVMFHEIFAGIWVRNGLQIRGQAMTYVQCHFCNSMVDSDIYLLQICATVLDPDFFVKTVLQRFHVLDLFTFSPDEGHAKLGFIEPDKQMPMLEATLTFLSLIIALRNHLGLSERDLTRLEMVTLLCTADRTHSQIKDLLPEKCGVQHSAADAEPILKETADFKAPVFEAGGTMQQGMYSPKARVWEQEYDPLFVLLRSMYKKDFQNSMDRFTNYVKQKGLYMGSDSPWPPFRIPAALLPQYQSLCRVLHCRTMHGLLFTLLYKCVHDKTMSDAVVYFTVYLLELAVSIPNPAANKPASTITMSGARQDKDLSGWYASDVIDVNLREVVERVRVTVPYGGEDGGEGGRERAKRSRNDDNDVDDLFELAPSAMSTSQGLVTSWGNTSSEVINAVQALLEETVSAEEGGTNNNGVATSPRVRNMGVSTNMESHFKTVDVNVSESMLSLLWKLYEKLSTDKGLYKPPEKTVDVETGLNAKATKPNETGKASGLPQSGSISSCDIKLSADVRTKTPRGVSGLGANAKAFPSKSSAPRTSQKGGAYSKTSRAPDCKSGAKAQYESRVGNGAFFVGKLLDKICESCHENRDILTEMYENAAKKQTSRSEGKVNTMDERRRKARERQQKLMADFAQKRKLFMEKNKEEMNSGSEDESDSKDAFESMSLQLETLYDCVICNVPSASTDENPIGLVGLLQATSVLAHRSRQVTARVLPVSDKTAKQNYVTFGTEWSSHINALLDNFNETSCVMSVNIGWQGGIHVQTCGHHVHLTCHKAYVTSLRNDVQHSHTLRADKGEFWCPLCRQLSNTTLPILPEVGPALMEPLPSGDRNVVEWVTRYLNQRPATPCSSALTSAMSTLMEDLTKATDQKYKTCGTSPTVESVILFVCSVLRCNLETEILQGELSSVQGSPLVASAKPCILPLVHVLGMHSKILSTQHYTELWKLVVGNWAGEDTSSTSVTLRQKEVPLLMRDSTALLLQLVLTMPPTMDKDVYVYLVKALYNVCYVQALIKVSLEFSEEERTAWRSKVKLGSQKVENSLEAMLSKVIVLLSNSCLYEDDSASDPFVPAICGRIWSPQSVESELQLHCLPYLRVASCLQHHLYALPLPATRNTDQGQEFKVLCSYVGLSPRVTTLSDEDLQLSSASCLKWLCDDPGAQIKAWCSHLLEFTARAQATARMLLSIKPQWHCPQLLQLPQQYEQIFQFYRRKPCQNCNSLPKDPAICLVCGALLCSKERCCYQLGKYECVQHSVDCGGGVAIYLLVLSSYIVLLRGPRASVWGSVYLDEHGEEDRDLKRGKPLYLSEERYKVLRHQWLSHSFDKVCKRWILHRDQL